MQNRLQQFLKAENITQSQFADSIGVARASITHIISGRNKPGFDFIERFAQHYPDVNLDWLLLGKGRMYRSSEDIVETPQRADTLTTSPAPPSSPLAVTNKAAQVMDTAEEPATPCGRDISRIIVLYTDGTYREFK